MSLRRLSVLLLAALPLLGQEEPRIGLEAHGLVPMGDLRDLTDGQLGLGFGAFVDIPLSESWRIRPRVGVQHIPKGDTLGLAGTQTSVTSVDLMVDGLWYPGENALSGPYLVGSIGGQMWRLSATGTNASSLSHGRLGAAGGLGYQYSPMVAFELKGFWSPIDPAITAAGLSLGATWRF